MDRPKLCLNLDALPGIAPEEQLKLYKGAGFDGFFSGWKNNETIRKYRSLAEELGMIYQSVHGPFKNAANMWKSGEVAEAAVEELLTCIRDCAEYNVPIVVLHVFIGFGQSESPNEAGIENYRRVVEEARRLNVKIALENTEGDEYLAVLMAAFRDYENVGFCWDTGHELCYNGAKDMTALYGDRLIATHLNDNLGVRDYPAKYTYYNDLHLLPFDGINDWQNIVNRLNKCGYDGILTFELKAQSKPTRHDNDKYMRIPVEEYIAEAYARACKVAALKTAALKAAR